MSCLIPKVRMEYIVPGIDTAPDVLYVGGCTGSEKGRGSGTWRRKRVIPWAFCTGLEVFATLLCLKWITSKGLLYSTGNSTQCYMPVWMGESFWGE